MSRFHILVFFLLFGLIFQVYSQESQDSVKQEIRTKDGNIFVGYVVDQTPQIITMQTETIGVVKIKLSEIEEILIIRQNGKTSSAGIDPQSTRYFFSPNGYGLKKGEGYYQNVWVFFNQVSVGVGEKFQIGGGLMPFFLIAGGPTPIWITPKVNIPVTKDRFNIGIGGLFGTVIGEGESLGILYGQATFGSREKNMSLGFGWAYSGGRLAERPVFAISGMKRLNSRWHLLTENYIFSDYGDTIMLIMLGARRITNKTGIDFGLITPMIPDLGEVIVLPWLGVTVPFGN